MSSALDSGLSKLGQDLLLRSKAIADAIFTYIADEKYRELRAMDIAAAVLTAATVYLSLLVLYRLLFSPIARFPGPKLAAATEWYEFYYQLVQNGQWGRQVDRLHDQYGPIVRITPWQLSIRDPSYYSQLYVAGSTRRTDMWARGREGSGFQGSFRISPSKKTAMVIDSLFLQIRIIFRYLTTSTAKEESISTLSSLGKVSTAPKAWLQVQVDNLPTVLKPSRVQERW
ncbi:MAG: hypothetical protein Q9228_002343 [Teloschistes exilis]